MTNSASSLIAILFGVAVFAVIVAVGWRSVQNRRILRLQGADGQETIIVAGEDDEITSIATTTETAQAPAAEAAIGESAAGQAKVAASGRKRLNKVVSSIK